MSAQTRILGHILHAYGRRFRLAKGSHPITLTFSVTSRCQSRCLTCHIGDKSRKGHFKDKPDLSLDEIEKIFKSLGKLYFFNVSGGEPFLRSDLPDIVELAIEHLKPGIIHIPTNALAPGPIEKGCREILQKIRKRNIKIPLTVKPSIDGLGDLHDKIRGVRGNFEKLEETIIRLKLLEEEFPEFHLELGTVISRYNIGQLSEIEDYVHTLGVQSYRNEIAEERAEFFNKGDGIAPSAELYEKVIQRFAEEIRRHVGKKRPLTRLTESLRLTYYEFAVKILKKRTQVIPCYGGISNLHLNYNGQLWPCCVLGYDKPLADLRDLNYDVQRAMKTPQARAILDFIRKKGCYCPLANQWYSNILLNPLALARVILNYFFIDLRRKRA
ncbi:radical SAM protein [candidate division LCP-89 bacterium B3_LCP]|uniref:Radical SAM protein n=1 Tax=candidate division LCP-89 bacterium B3_LCP TaxID=2012998 RepID=A0A532V302_UNCL8|nr:MAG: radical SAM protein [candidate division LCP-89 bacterium B3_LCP]